jgi:DNA-directed RNA polymerase specialized sigma24 family protein
MPLLTQRRTWTWTAERFTAFLVALDGNADRAAQRYEKLRLRLMIFFTSRHCGFPEDLADEVLDRLARRLSDGEQIDSVEAYSLGIARLVVLEQSSKVKREQRSREEYVRNISSAAYTQSERNDAELRMAGLDVEQPAARLLEQYYEGRGATRIRQRQQMAQALGISMNTLRKRMFDLRASIRREWKTGQ